MSTKDVVTTSDAETLVAARKRVGLTQAEVATQLGISRPSYVAVEQGKRELSVQEFEKISGLLQLSYDAFSQGVVPKYEKYKQMILAFLRAGADVRDGVPKTNLAKLLYLADFAWYYEHMESMSGMTYRKIQYGPVPDLYFRAVDELFESGEIDIKPTDVGDGKIAFMISPKSKAKNMKIDLLSLDEIKLVDTIAEKWRTKKTGEIVEFTHGQMPYAICRMDEIIPYSLITQEEPDAIY